MTSFDPNQYKITTRQQWEDAAGAWHRWGPTLESWLGEATERMLDAARVGPGSRVLDVAAGAGGQTILAARRVGPGGRVLATDISPTILTYAAKAAAEAGLGNVETLEVDGETLDVLDPGSFDAVVSRVGLIYFPDQQRALVGMRRTLRPGGRIAAIVYSTAERNEFFSIPVSIIRRRANLPHHSQPARTVQPRPPRRARAGPHRRRVRRRLGRGRERTAAAALGRGMRPLRARVGALHQMLVGVPAAERESVWDEIGDALAPFEGDGGFVGPCELLVASGAAKR